MKSLYVCYLTWGIIRYVKTNRNTEFCNNLMGITHYERASIDSLCLVYGKYYLHTNEIRIN